MEEFWGEGVRGGRVEEGKDVGDVFGDCGLANATMRYCEAFGNEGLDGKSAEVEPGFSGDSEVKVEVNNKEVGVKF